MEYQVRRFCIRHGICPKGLQSTPPSDKEQGRTAGSVCKEQLSAGQNFHRTRRFESSGIGVVHKYRWEIRKVTKDGFVSFDGARHGIPWQYAGQELRVRVCGDTFEAYDGEVRIAAHKVEYAFGRIVWLKGQYQGLAEHDGLPKVAPFARQSSNVSVEIRSLDIYDQFTGWHPMIELEHTRNLLEAMGLTTAAEFLDARLVDASHRELTYLTFLGELLDVEQKERKRRSEKTRIKLSRLPSRKTLEEFDFNFQPSIDPRQMKELSTLAFAARNENVVFLGSPGVGKTHLTVRLAMQALRNGMSVYFATMPQLIADLSKASAQGQLERRWQVYLRPDMISSLWMRLDTCSLIENQLNSYSASYVPDMKPAALS